MNALVDYIKTHPNWRSELSEKPYCLTIKKKDLNFGASYNIFSYNQIESDFSLPVVQVSRGIILKITEACFPEEMEIEDHVIDIKVVCWPFSKFFNYSEPNAHSIDWSSAKVQEKIDGCLDEKVQIETPEGYKSIKNLCELHYRGLVRSRNLDTGEVCWDSVEADSIQENNNDWYELELEDGRTVKLTGNHRIWLPELKCWRQVKDLEGHEKVDVI